MDADAAVTDALVGRLVDGRYRVEARLARGGMASVYTALDTRLDRLVALKVMHPVFAEDDEFVGRFIREAKSAARLSHPNVVSVYDQGEDGGHVFLVMEYVEGRTLRDLVHERGKLTPSEALSILQPVLSALAAAHEAGIVHRDIKPENVLLADDGRVKVADFGLARAIAGRHTATTSSIIGTVAYLAPEYAVRNISDARSDVYSAGVMLYEMLTGAPPYDSDAPLNVMYRHANEDIPPPSEAVPGIPAVVDTLVQRATSRDPDSRPRDASVFLAEVVRARRSLPAMDADTTSATAITPRSNDTIVVALPDEATFGPPPRRGPRRRRGTHLIVLLVVLLLAAGAGVAAWWFASGRYQGAPSFTSMTWAQAQAAARAGNVKVKQGDAVYSETVQEGQVVSQDPKPGDRLVRGATVTVHLSKGREPIPVTNYEGQNGDDAKAALEAAHLTVTVEQAWSDTVQPGVVVAQDPKDGTLHRGDGVKLVVSKGPQPIDVQDFTGKSADDAKKALERAGFKVTPNEVYSDTVDAGIVITQDPNSGTGKRGDTITLTVSKGPELFEVPPVTGKSVKDAKKILKDAGFKADVVFGNGTVFQQSPSAHEMKPKGTTVKLIAGF